MAIQRPTIKLVDIQRSVPGKLWETEMYVHIYEAEKQKGKMTNWIPKDDIDKMEFEEVNDGLKSKTVEIVKEAPKPSPKVETVTFEDNLNDSDDEDDLELLSISELQDLCNEKGIKFHHKAKEEKLIKLLKA